MRPYSESLVPVKIFLDLLNSIGCHGWRRAGPTVPSDFDQMPTIAFHVNKEAIGLVQELFSAGLRGYQGRTNWSLRQRAEGQFFLCPSRLLEESGVPDADALRSVRAKTPELGQCANRDLVLLADSIYEAAASEGRLTG
jgi:hypothetical protein